MTIRQAITLVDDVKPNVYSVTTKVRWLQDLDAKIKTSIIDTHEGDEIPMPEYTDADMDVELLVGQAYDEIYVSYLKMMIDLHNNEFDLYNNEAEVFNTQFVEYGNYYNRTHMPKSNNFNFF